MTRCNQTRLLLFITAVLILSAIMLLSGCATAKYIKTGPTAAAKADDCDIEVFSSKLPDRAYDELGIIEGEGSFGADTLSMILPKMKIEACRAGGDAIIITSSDNSFDGEDNELNVTATVIRWKE